MPSRQGTPRMAMSTSISAGSKTLGALQNVAIPVWGSEAEARAAFIECLLCSKLSLRPLEQCVSSTADAKSRGKMLLDLLAAVTRCDVLVAVPVEANHVQ